ncbi:hypothetical protein PW683_03600 [Streptomyces niveus]
MHTSPGDDQWPPRRRQQSGHPLDLIRSRHVPVEREVTVGGAPGGGFRDGFGQDVLGHQQDDRAGTSGGRFRHRHVDVVVDPGRVVDPVDRLGAGAEQLHMVQFLEGVAVAGGPRYLLDDGEHRNRCLERLGERGYEKRRGGAVLRRDHPDPAGDPRVTVGHRTTGVLRAVDDLPYRLLRRRQEKQRRQALPEHIADPVTPQRRRQTFSDRIPHFRSSVELLRQCGRFQHGEQRGV